MTVSSHRVRRAHRLVTPALVASLMLAACSAGSANQSPEPAAGSPATGTATDTGTATGTAGSTTQGASEASSEPTTSNDSPPSSNNGDTPSTPPDVSPPTTIPPSPPTVSPPVTVPPPFARARHRAIWIGDSLAANGWGSGGNVVTTPGGGFVVQSSPTGNIATITTTSAHNLLPGNYVHIYNAGDATYSAPLNGAVVQVLTVPSPTQFTVSASYAGQSMATGDYSAYHGQLWLIQSMFQVRDQSWLQWLNQYLKGYFSVVATYAEGGSVSSVGVALLPKIAAGPKAEYAFIQYCTNDVNSGSSDVAHCLSNIKTIVAALEAQNIVPILCTPPAIGDPNAPSDPATAAKAAALQAVLQGEQQLAQEDPHIILIDIWSRTVTPGDPLGHFLPNYAPLDGVHPLSYGGVKIAQSASADLVKLLPLGDLLPATPADDATASPSGFNIVQNGFMTGTGGVFASTPYNTITGTMPTGWTFAALGGTQNAPLAFNVSANGLHPMVTGTTLDISVEYAAAGQGFQTGTNGPGSNFGPRMVPGSWYRCGFELVGYTDLSHLNLYGTVWLRLADATQVSVDIMGNGGAQVENGTPLETGSPLQYLSQPFQVPQAVSAGYLFITGHFSGTPGTQKLSLGRAMCRTVENPYQ